MQKSAVADTAISRTDIKQVIKIQLTETTITNWCNMITDGKATVLATKVINVSLNKTNEITVYPNPAQDVVNIKFEGDQYNSVKLIDINGKVLIVKPIATKESQVSLEISNLPSATYIIQLNGKAGAVSKTIVKN